MLLRDARTRFLGWICTVLYRSTDPAKHLLTAGQGLRDLDRELSDLSEVWCGYMPWCSSLRCGSDTHPSRTP